MISVEIMKMKTSAGTDYYVQFTCGDRSTTLHMFKQRYQAEYTADHYRWVFGLLDEDPDILAYDETTHPND